MPHIEDDDDCSSGGEEVVVGHSRPSLRCPLTQRILEDPVVKYTQSLNLLVLVLGSPGCGHVFSQKAIQDLAEQLDRVSGRGAGQISCPVAGCSRNFTLDQLKPDRQISETLARFANRMFPIPNSSSMGQFGSQRGSSASSFRRKNVQSQVIDDD